MRIVTQDDFAAMTPEQLRETRTRLAEDLEDYKEMAIFHSMNSPAHETSIERQAHSGKMQRMTETIARIDAFLADSSGELAN